MFLPEKNPFLSCFNDSTVVSDGRATGSSALADCFLQGAMFNMLLCKVYWGLAFCQVSSVVVVVLVE